MREPHQNILRMFPVSWIHAWFADKNSAYQICSFLRCLNVNNEVLVYYSIIFSLISWIRYAQSFHLYAFIYSRHVCVYVCLLIWVLRPQGIWHCVTKGACSAACLHTHPHSFTHAHTSDPLGILDLNQKMCRRNRLEEVGRNSVMLIML